MEEKPRIRDTNPRKIKEKETDIFFLFLFFKETAKLNFTSKLFIFQRKNLTMCLCKIRLDDLFPPTFLFSQRNRDQNSTVNLKEPKKFFFCFFCRDRVERLSWEMDA